MFVDVHFCLCDANKDDSHKMMSDYRSGGTGPGSDHSIFPLSILADACPRLHAGPRTITARHVTRLVLSRSVNWPASQHQQYPAWRQAIPDASHLFSNTTDRLTEIIFYFNEQHREYLWVSAGEKSLWGLQIRLQSSIRVCEPARFWRV